MRTGNVEIHDLTISAEDWPDEYGHEYVWRTGDISMPKEHGGTDETGRILVCLDIDGPIDIVYADLTQSGHLASLDRAITALEQVRAGLTAAYQGRDWPGRCFAQGGWGRCHESHGHDGEHRFPTEVEYDSLRVVHEAGA